jgi:AcrR family transcriptional regulator
MSRRKSIATIKPPGSIRILEAALSLITKRGGADVTMAEIARAARLSRQAVYLHFSDRANLLVALVRYVDEKRGLAKEIRAIIEAPSGAAAIRAMASLQARMNPGVWAAARSVDAVRRTDAAAERSWQDRLQNRLDGCRRIVQRLHQEGSLRPGLDPTTATDLLWTITSLRTWEDLVLERGWSAQQYEERVSSLLLATLTIGEERGASSSP